MGAPGVELAERKKLALSSAQTTREHVFIGWLIGQRVAVSSFSLRLSEVRRRDMGEANDHFDPEKGSTHLADHLGW